MVEKLVERDWDYSMNAPYYKYRPNYNPRAIDLLVEYVGGGTPGFSTADIGAGTGNLSVLLSERNLKVVAVEPNDSMREEGKRLTVGDKNISWIKANGVNTTLESERYDWVAFGSSFNVMDRQEALKETYRILKKDGYFSCMWNHRDLNDPTQGKVENIILEFVPEYTRGVRREDQRPEIESSGLFKDIFYMEMDFEFNQTPDNYINAWRSVKNKYWDLSTKEGSDLFESMAEKIKKVIPADFKVKYTTRVWTAQKK